MTLSLDGRVTSKKNSRQIFRAGNRIVVSTSKAYKSWHEYASYQILSKRPKTPLTGTLAITIHFQLKGKLDSDVDNMMASLIDLLQDMAFIENDKQIVEAHLYKSAGHPDFATTIELTQQSAPVVD